MRWAIIKFVLICFTSTLFALVHSVSASAWSAVESPEFISSEVKTIHPNPCSGEYADIAVKGEGTIKACVMGKDTKVASFSPAQGGVGYAVRFPFEKEYYLLDICDRVWGCVYSSENDTFATTAGVIYKNFVSKLTKMVFAGITHYLPDEQSAVNPVADLTSIPMRGETAAISSNGEWVVIEMGDYGVFQIHTQSLDVRRVVAPGVQYGYGVNPRVEIAVSNDGKAVAVMGLRMSVQLVMVNDTCGDRPREEMARYYTGAVTACPSANIPYTSYIEQFNHATMPRFSEDSQALSFNIHSWSAPALRVAIFSNTKPSTTLKYVAIGDSFVSGEGEIKDSFYIGGASNRCHVSSRSYPLLLASRWGVEGYNAACSGATMNTARNEKLQTHQTTQLGYLESQAPKIVTVGVGGNDAGLMGKLKSCVGLDTCEWAKDAAKRRDTALEIKNLYPRLQDFYKEVQAKTPGSVVVVGYPKIISSSPECASSIGILLNETERIFMNESIQYLNAVIRAAAGSLSLRYISVENAFEGKEICTRAAPPLMNEVRFGDDYSVISQLPSLKIIGAESFHPTPSGHERIADTISNMYENISYFDSCTGCFSYSGVPSLSNYWNSAAGNAKNQQAFRFLDKTSITKGGALKISFPAFSFQPKSEVTLELHSEIKKIGVFKATDDGSLETTVALDGAESGYHSVHAVGKGYSEVDVDLYDFLQIEPETTVPVSNTSEITINQPIQQLPPTTHPKQQLRSGEALNASIVETYSLDVLGASTSGGVGAAQQPVVSRLQPSEIGKTERTEINQSGSSLQMIAVVMGVLLSIGLVYMFYRLKHRRS